MTESQLGRFFVYQSMAGVNAIGNSAASGGTALVPVGSATIKTSGGAIVASRSTALTLGTSTKLPIVATGTIANSSAAAMIGRGLGVALKVGNVAGLAALALELGYKLYDKSDGGVGVREMTDPGCSDSCFSYMTRTWDSAAPQPRTNAGSRAFSCKIAVAEMDARSSSFGYNHVILDTSSSCVFRTNQANEGQWSYYNWVQSSIAAAPSPPSYSDTSTDKLVTAITNKSSWDDASKIPEAIKDAQKLTGEEVPVKNPKITGPASVNGPSTVTKTPTPTGSKETTIQDSFDCHYNDPSYDGTVPGTVVCTQKTTTTDKITATDPQTNQTIQTTTQTSETTKPADTTAEKPKETPDPCLENPDRVGCSTLDTPDFDVPKSQRTVGFSAVDLGFGGGTCPANISQSIHGQQVLVFDWAKGCDYVATYVKPLFLMLATFAAMVIIFLGGKTE